MLGEGDLLAAEGGQGEVGDLEVLSVLDSRHCELLLGVWVEGGYGWSARRRTQGCPKEDTGMPAYAQRSPSEALSPSAGPLGTARPPSAATSGSVPSYTGRGGDPQSVGEHIEPIM
ncbi:hypothetical protein GCM10010104_60940 [Streptomyces indiaensis]|uniref:Uncharacterized protein n=1 Tax=Streptomyces indiaensis TaxID=284033 RepID=A0ABN3EEP0_9ACTN